MDDANKNLDNEGVEETREEHEFTPPASHPPENDGKDDMIVSLVQTVARIEDSLTTVMGVVSGLIKDTPVHRGDNGESVPWTHIGSAKS